MELRLELAGAGAEVTEDISPVLNAAGIPARVIKS